MNQNFFSNPFFGSIGRRIKRKRDVIQADDGNEMVFLTEEESEFNPEGDFITTQTVYSKILPDGWKVGANSVVAKCAVCGSLVSRMAVRYCLFCGNVSCALHARYWKGDQNTESGYACEQCYRSLRRKRIFSFIGRLITSVFLEKKDA